MILAQLLDPHIVAAGKLFRCPIQGTSPDAERARLEFDTAPYLARAVASLNALVPRPDVTLVTGDLVDHGACQGGPQATRAIARLALDVVSSRYAMLDQRKLFRYRSPRAAGRRTGGRQLVQFQKQPAAALVASAATATGP